MPTLSVDRSDPGVCAAPVRCASRPSIIGLGLLLCVLLAGTAAAECTTSICTPDACLPGFSGDCCTIAGTHLLDDLCLLDFGSKTVTVAGSTTLKAAVAGGSFRINAGDLIVRGLLQAPGGSSVYPTIEITVSGAFKTESVSNSPGTIDLKASGPTDPGSVDATALGSVMLFGKDVSADGGTAQFGGDISITGASIAITSPVHSNGVGGSSGGYIYFESTTGDVSIGGPISSNCTGAGGVGGSITAFAAAAISVTAALQTRGTVGSSGGAVDLEANGNANVSASITATGSGNASDGGMINVQAGRTKTITISSTLDVRSTTTNGDIDGTIFVGPACAVRLSGTLRSRNTTLNSGSNNITYNGSFDATGSTMLADDYSVDGGNFVSCRCADANSDGVCDVPLQCASAPVLTGATVTPAVAIDTFAESPCSCGNGVLDPGEQCDDGNQTNGDCCSALCRFEPNGGSCSDDGNSCTTDQCNGAGTCVHAAKASGAACVDDGNACTTDQCDAAGTCVHTAGNAGAVCRAATAPCNIAATCTGASATCPPNSVQPDGTPCNDNNPCTSGDVCTGGLCVGTPGDCQLCCTDHNAPGCGDSSCEACICSFDSFCCNVRWDFICVSESSNQCAASCPPPCGAAPPTPTGTPTTTPTPADTATPTATPAPTDTAQSIDTATPTVTPPPTATASPAPPTPTFTPTPTPTVTPPNTATPTPTDTATACPTGTPCAADSFKMCQPPNQPPGNTCDCTSCQPCPPCPPGQVSGCGQFECGCACVPASPTPTPTPVLDHFTSYSARITTLTARFTPVAGVSLIDQFGSATVNVRKPLNLCNPTNTNDGDPTALAHPDHLTGYQIVASRRAAPFVKVPHQKVVNQFGTLFVDVIKPVRLLFPSATSLIIRPPAPVNPAVDLFKCYTTRVSKGTPKFTPIRGVTTIADKFETVTMDVIRPAMLCVPANKDNEEPGAETHAGELMCYKTKAVRGSPRFAKVNPVFATDELTSETFDVLKPLELCVPSLKGP